MQGNHQRERVTAFDWQRFAQQQNPRPQAAGSGSRKPGSKSERPMSASERAERILATRWASPYSKAGVPSKDGSRGN